MKNFYSIFSFELLHNLHLGVLKNFIAQYLSSEGLKSHSTGQLGKRIRMSLLKWPLLRACNGLPTQIEENCGLPDWL